MQDDTHEGVANTSDATVPSQQLQNSKRSRVTLNLPTIVVGLLCIWSLDTEDVVQAYRGGIGIVPSIVSLLRIAPSSGLELVCAVLNGLICGIAMAAVCPQRVGLHIVCAKLLSGCGLFVVSAVFAAFTMDPMFIRELLWLAAALGAGLLAQHRITRPMKHVKLAGIGDAWEPQVQRRLALFFGICLALALVPYVVRFLGFAGGIGQGLAGIKTGLNAPVLAPETGDLIVGSGLGVMLSTSWLWGDILLAILIGSGFLGLILRCFPNKVGPVLAQPGASIVWLRPFDVDGMAEGLSTKTELVFSPWKRVLGATLEQKISRCFRGFAKLVAAGMPGERLPQAGAARLYVDHANWQSVVEALMRTCGGVVLHAATSEGTLWEWRAAIAALPRTRILLCVPVRGFSWRARKRKYRKLRAHVEQATGVLLPEEADTTAAFAFFESDHSPRAVWLMPWKRIPATHHLSPVLVRLQRLRLRLQPRKLPVILLCILAILLAIRYAQH